MNHGGVCRTAPATPGLLKTKKKTYEKALDILELEDLSLRRDKLCKSFALKAVQKSSPHFKLIDNSYTMKLKNPRKYEVTHCNTDRLKMSAIPQMQHMLNEN